MKKAIKEITRYLLLLILISSCKSVKIKQSAIIGKYQHHGVYGIASNITLNNNNTFTYHWQTGLIGGTTYGNWKLDGNTLILNSDKQPSNEADFKIIERAKTNKNQLEITVIDENEKEKLIYAYCFIMNDTTFIAETTTDVNGNCILPFNQDSSILHISYLGYRPVEIPVSRLTSNSFIVEIKEEGGFYIYFTNRAWKIKRGRIYDPEIRKDKYVKKNYYERIVQ